MKIVVDANIFVSSYFWRGNPRTVINRAISGTDTVLLTNEIFREICRVIRKEKFHASEEQVIEFAAGG